MILASLARALSALFTGAAAYINWSEQPARLALDDAQLLKEWNLSYANGTRMQAPLALVAALVGFVAFFFEGSLLAIAGGVLMLANWPYTLLAIMPTNKRLEAMDNDADPRPLIRKWGQLHGGRTLLGFAAVCAFLFAEAGF